MRLDADVAQHQTAGRRIDHDVGLSFRVADLLEGFRFLRGDFEIEQEAIGPARSEMPRLDREEPSGRAHRPSCEAPPPGDRGRSSGEPADRAGVVRGEKRPDYSADHGLAVQEALLRASGMG